MGETAPRKRNRHPHPPMRQLVVVIAVVSVACGTSVPGLDGGAAGGNVAGGRASAGGNAAGGNAAGGNAAGGNAAGGSAGGAGGGAANGCAPLESAYLVAVEAAKRCPLNALVNPCSATRPNVVTCGCPTFIDPNNAAPVDALQTRYTDAGCVPMACPRCAPLDAGSCEPFDGGAVGEGLCVDRR